MRRDFFIMMGICLTLSFGYITTAEHQVLDTTQTQTITVRSGDTLWSIAERTASNEMDVRNVVYAMKSLNNLDGTKELQPGMKLAIPTVKKVNPAKAVDYNMAQN